MVKKQQTHLEKLQELLNEFGQPFREAMDEYDFTELTVDSNEYSIEFYFDREGKFVSITKVIGKS